jgi:Protein of unknown function (DUF3467)
MLPQPRGEKEARSMTEPAVASTFVTFPQNLPSVYANQVNVIASIHDVRLEFGRHQPAGGVAYDVAIYLSYPALKQTVTLLQNIIDQYERTIGPINVEVRPEASQP